MWGSTGITRLFGSEMGTQISWLLPAALFFIGVLLWGTRRAARTDGKRAAVLIWGSWLVVTGLVFSFMQGIIHPYYTVVLAPAIGALVGIGVTWTWARRENLLARLALATALAVTAVWGFVLLDRTPTWHPALRFAVLVGGIASRGLRRPPVRPIWGGNRAVGRAVLLASLVFALAAPAAYAAQTASTAHSGSLPSAGPAGSVRQGGPGRRGAAGRVRAARRRWRPAAFGGPPGGFAPTGGAGARRRDGGGRARRAARRRARRARRSSRPSRRTRRATAGSRRSSARTAPPASSSASGKPVMAIGGFNGTDPSPTLAQFEAYVAAGKIHYFVASGGGGGGPGAGSSASSSAIATWVEQNFTSTTVGGVTLYDLSA